MISYARLPGTLNSQALSGISEWFGMPSYVKSYWDTVKRNIQAIKDTGYQISLYQQKLGVAKSMLVAKNDPRKNLLDDEIRKVQDDLDKWWKVKGYIDTHMPQWAQLDSNTANVQPSGVGAAPFVLAGMGLTALTYTVTVGMALVQDYAWKRSLTADVIAGKVSSGQGAELLSVPREQGVFAETIKAVSTSVGFGIPTALLIGGGLYLLLITGSLKGLLGGGSSQSSGG